jgi:hypothetical protein
MKTVKIHAIKARAKRLNMPHMIGKYKEYAITWHGDTCELEEHDHAELNAMWDESKQPVKPKKKPCSSCRGGL